MKGSDNQEPVVKEIPDDIMRELLHRPLGEKMRILNRHKKERKPVVKRKYPPKPRPKNRAALMKKQKKVR